MLLLTTCHMAHCARFFAYARGHVAFILQEGYYSPISQMEKQDLREVENRAGIIPPGHRTFWSRAIPTSPHCLESQHFFFNQTLLSLVWKYSLEC